MVHALPPLLVVALYLHGKPLGTFHLEHLNQCKEDTKRYYPSIRHFGSIWAWQLHGAGCSALSLNFWLVSPFAFVLGAASKDRCLGILD
jgi:hypothetical protein